MNSAFLASLACPDLSTDQLTRLAVAIEADQLLERLMDGPDGDHHYPAPNKDELDFYQRRG
jgi:hypothetical protein